MMVLSQSRLAAGWVPFVLILSNTLVAQTRRPIVDFNRDGFADLAIGVPERDVGALQAAGAVVIVYGSAAGLSQQVLPSVSWTLDGIDRLGQDIQPDSPAAGDRFGAAIATGDFDGDGYTDLAVGAPGRTVNGRAGAGAVYLIHGTPEGLRRTSRTEKVTAVLAGFLIQIPGGIRARGEPQDGAAFGFALAAGDFDGDGRDDLAVGAPLHDVALTYESDAIDAGAVYVNSGDPSGLNTASAMWDQDTVFGNGNDVWHVQGRAEDFDHFGFSLAAGRLNGDACADLVIGVPRENLEDHGFDGDDAGAVHVLFGWPDPQGGLRPFWNQLWTQDGELSTGQDIQGTPGAFDQFGWSVAVGDFNGDVFEDLAIGVPNDVVGGANPVVGGAVNVIYSGGNGPRPLGNQIWSQWSLGIAGSRQAGVRFGHALATADFNGDLRVDLAVGVPWEPRGTGLAIAEAGAVTVLYGAPNTLDPYWVPSQYLAQGLTLGGSMIAGTAQAGDRFGSALGGGNFDGAAGAELVIGVPFESLPAKAGAGVVQVLVSLATGLTAAGNQMLHQDLAWIAGASMAGDRFGAAVSGR